MSSEFQNPKRWRPPSFPIETGTWIGGIHNPEMLMLFGTIISSWVHIEEAMIDVMNLLVFVDYDIRRAVHKKTRGHFPGKQIFRSMSANGVRAQMMRNLLSQYIGNYQKDPLYDDVVAEFQSLVNIRNDYLHGLWWTKQDGTVYLQTENMNEMAFNRKKKIEKKDLESFIDRCSAIPKLIREIQAKEYLLSEAKRETDARTASAEKA